MTLIDRLHRERAAELASITKCYVNLQRIYEGLLERHDSSVAVAWCRSRLLEGFPEWLVGWALATAHANMILELLKNTPFEERMSRLGPVFLSEQPARSHLEKDAAWEIDTDRLEAALEVTTYGVLRKHGALGRPERGYAPGTFLRVARAVGLVELDVPHAPLFSQA